MKRDKSRKETYIAMIDQYINFDLLMLMQSFDDDSELK